MQDLTKYDYNLKVRKLDKLENNTQRLKMIFMWVKTRVITYTDFESLISYNNDK